MSTSFIVNLGDLNKILEQIKIAERDVAGEDLVDIIGQDASLLPLGLRTVDGSFNHLLPGQSQAGAADENFPRLLTPTYIDDADGDFMPLGPFPAPAVINTNYDPTITTSTNPVGVNVHSVADADPRIISNLIVDQTLTNRSAIVSALILAEAPDAASTADLIIQARDAAAAAAPFAAATASAYALAVTGAGTVQTQLTSAFASLTALRGDASTDSVVNTPANATDAVTAVTAALAAANNVLTALQAPNTTVAASDIAAASAQVNALTSFLSAVTAVQGIASGGVIVPEYDAIVLAQSAAHDLVTVAQENATALAHAVADPAVQHLIDLIRDSGLELSSDGSILIGHRSPDIGLSPPNSAWMTFFGQFFDHGLDLVTKGGNGTIYIPLQPDDPLIAGADHIFGTPDDLPAQLQFMTLSRITPFDANGNPSATGTEAQNTTTPFVDQNQTYTSNASHQVFLREYKFTVDSATDSDSIADSHAMNTGRLLNGVNGGIATWGEAKAQAAEKLGLILNDADVLNVPQLLVDAYGKFTPGTHGYAQVMVNVFENDGSVTRVSTIAIEGKAGGLDIHHILPADLPAGFVPLAGVISTAFQVIGTGHAFLNDIAHTAEPVIIGGVLQADPDSDIGNAVPDDHQGHNLQYDNELLDAHFLTGDGRGNENIGLTAVHNIFHSEHNRLVEVNKDTIIASGDAAVVNEWLAAGPGNVRNAISQAGLDLINAMPTTDPVEKAAKAAAIDALDWDGERLFQAARFVTEMQYQHLVFEEFARRIQPNVDPFVFTNSADLNPAIIAEFAHTVYRFGHSMLVDSVDRLDNDLSLVNSDDIAHDDPEQVSLIEAFLNPREFTASGAVYDSGGAFVGYDDEVATGALIRGMSRSVGNEIDEFVVEALRNNLLGLPLDLPALNIARGRDTGIPTLNDARAQIYAATGAADLKPYTSWVDFAQHIKHPLSVINFIAAYGTHEAITLATTLAEKRAAASLLVLGDGDDSDGVTIGAHVYHDRLAFLNATGDFAPNGVAGHDDSRGGLNKIDLWIGGLAEELNEFGGQLGSTFNYVFEYQMEHLQNGDRFYYLSRTQGMNLLNLLEPNTFTDLVMRNTDLGNLHSTHLPAVLMSVPDITLELDRLAGQANYSGDSSLDGTDPLNRSDLDPTHDDPFLQGIDPKVVRVEGTLRMNGAIPALDGDGQQIFDGGILKFSGGEHVTLGGTEGNDSLFGDKGIDTLWGDGGDDYLNAGMESDNVFGGDGDDIIEDPFGDNFLRGEAGNDVISSDTGLSLLFGGEGQDFMMGNTDMKEFFAGPGNDFLLGGTDSDAMMGNEGDDWIEGGEGFDGIDGGNSELFFNSIVDGNDILNGQGNDTDYDGENGDDIMVDGPGIQRNNGMDGFDWVIFKGDESPVDADMGIRPFDTRQALILRDRFDSVEGLSGWKNDDILTGSAKLLLGENFTDGLTQAGVDRIHGLRELLGLGPNTGSPDDVVFESDINTGGEIILGGDGNDTIRGNLGDDILDGDAWLNVRISVHTTAGASGPTGAEIASFEGLTTRNVWTLQTPENPSGYPATWQQMDNHGHGTGFTLSLAELMRSRLVNPGQLEGYREILTDTTHVGNSDPLHNRDIAVFSDIISNYTIEIDSNGDFGDGDGDGFITVAHTPVVGAGGGAAAAALRDSDGVDRIRNFEILSFADGNIFLDPSISNTAATGLLSITITNDLFSPDASVGDTFAVGIGSVTDADGPLPPLSAFTFTWQFEATPGANDWEPVTDPLTGDPVSGPTLTPTPAFEIDGLRLRAVGTFRDAEGIPEVVFSAPTAALAAQAVAVATTGDDILVGTSGPDFIDALAGDDDVRALGGDDIVIGGPGSDVLDGGELGSDAAVFFGPITNFTFSLNAEGNLEVVDNVTGDEDVVTNFEILVFIDSPPNSLNRAQIEAIVADALAGIVTPGVAFQSVAELTAGIFINDLDGASTLTGTEFDDVIFGNDADDIIDGLGGSDLLVGGDGDDDIDSGGGLNEVISGGDGTNTIRARAGDETFLIGLGENGSDTVRNDRGIERISVGAVALVDIPGQTGNVVAQPGAIAALDASDDGAGNLVVAVNGKTITITDHFNDADSVLELINFNGSSFDGIDLGTGDYNLVAAAAGVTTLDGGAGSDALFGTNASDTLNGNGGSDLLLGGGGADTLNGGAGNDLIDGGAGNNDTAVFSGSAAGNAFSINAAGTLMVTGPDGIDTLTGVERLQFGANTFVLRQGTGVGELLDGNANADLVIAGGGGDTVTAGGGNDVVFGGAGNDTINGGAGNDILNGEADNDTLDGGADNDTLNGGSGNDTINWDITNAGAGDGHDIVDGGTENAGGDTFSVDGNNQDEVYRVYSNTDDWDNNAGNGIVSSAAHAGLTGLAAGTEIIVTRNTNGLAGAVTNANIIGELADIEEIVINTRAGTNNVLAIGDFNGTALSFNTITVNDDGGRTTVDLTQLTSAHHVAFHTSGDDDDIIGARPQDQVFSDGSASPPPAGNDDEDEDDDNDNDNEGENDDDENEGEDDNDDSGNGGGDDDDNSGTGNDDDHACGGSGNPTGPGSGGPVLPPEAGVVMGGTPQSDVLVGGSGDDNLVGQGGDDVIIGNGGADAISAGDGADFVNGGEGRDVIFAGAGDDQVFGGNHADVIYGDAGADRIFGDQGNDMITAGAGDDSVFGGAGDDLFVAEINDGNDSYFGDDSDGGSGRDTLDISAATADTFVDLGSGPLAVGRSSSAQTGNDVLRGIENVNTGSGNDTIVASNAANVMNGGAGNDTFKFTTAASADGDTILGFAPGDRIDLSAIDANTGTAAGDAFTLITGAEFTAAGQLAVSFEHRADGDFTVIQGNVDGNMGADFRIEVEGNHTINSTNVTL